ncbi:SDR family NAD(P)-dependent oxidoreductase [Salipiger sp.]|uniref:SDR family NAD(P)-dependent oxidoreductase n=1 Tax=Salipiger sp. TaxID=2078585 RepID=UPI003A977987
MKLHGPGPVAVLTGAGAARGIGRATAAQLSRAGYRLVLNDLDAAALNDVKAELEEAGTEVADVCGDAAQPETATTLAAAARDRFGRCDVLVNNAGITGSVPFDEIDLIAWERMLRINLTSAFLCSQAVLPLMREGGGGAIVMVSSVAGRSGGSFGSAHYAASKAGMLGLARSLAAELGPDNIRVNAVAPASIDTDILKGRSNRAGLSPDEVRARRIARTPLGRLAPAEEVAAAICYLATPESSFVTGAVLDVNGGAFIG